MHRSQETAIAQMRKAVRKLGSSTEGYVDATLMRFLIARTLDAEKAAKMFAEWRNWRGLSRKGHPVVICKVNKHFPAKDQLQFKKFVVHVLDKTIASGFRGKEIGNEKMVAILDLQKISYRNIDVRGMITGFQFLQSYYPERLAKCYLLHMPGFFVHAWKIVSRFLDKATQEKVLQNKWLEEFQRKYFNAQIVIVTSDEERREFVGEVGEEALPEEYGGRAKFVLIQDVEVKPSDDSTCSS